MSTLGEPEVITLPEPGVIGLAERTLIGSPGLQHLARRLGCFPAEPFPPTRWVGSRCFAPQGWPLVGGAGGPKIGARRRRYDGGGGDRGARVVPFMRRLT